MTPEAEARDNMQINRSRDVWPKATSCLNSTYHCRKHNPIIIPSNLDPNNMPLWVLWGAYAGPVYCCSADSIQYTSCLTKPSLNMDFGYFVCPIISGSRCLPGSRYGHNLRSLFAERRYSVGRRWQWQPEGVGDGGERVGRSRICWQRGRFQDAARLIS